MDAAARRGGGCGWDRVPGGDPLRIVYSWKPGTRFVDTVYGGKNPPGS